MKLFLILLIVVFLPVHPEIPDVPGRKRIEKVLLKLWDDHENIHTRQLNYMPGSDENGILLEIYCDNDQLLGFLYSGRVYTCSSTGCTKPATEGEREYFHFFMVSDEKSRILHTEISLYAATHGHEVASRGWLKQFKDYRGNEQLEYGKNIDAISGATTSGENLTQEVETIVSKLKIYIDSSKAGLYSGSPQIK